MQNAGETPLVNQSTGTGRGVALGGSFRLEEPR
jgi:hypothetical protein